MHGISGHEGHFETQVAQQGLHRWDLVRLLVAIEMRQNQTSLGGICAQDMRGLAVTETVEAVAQRLAVDGDVALWLLAGLVVQDASVTSEYRFNRGRIQPPKNETDRGVGWRAQPFQTKEVSQTDEVDVDETVDAAVGVGSGDDRQNGKQDDVWQTLHLTFSPSRILDLGEQCEQRLKRLHGNPNATNQVASQRVRDFASLESSIRSRSNILARDVAFWTHAQPKY